MADQYHTAMQVGSGDGASTADFDMATLGPGDLVTLDQWQFGGAEEYDRLILRCPSHT